MDNPISKALWVVANRMGVTRPALADGGLPTLQYRGPEGNIADAVREDELGRLYNAAGDLVGHNSKFDNDRYGTWSNPEDQSTLGWIGMKAYDVGEGAYNAVANLASAVSPIGTSEQGNMALQVPPMIPAVGDAFGRLMGTPSNPGTMYDLSGIPELDKPILDDTSTAVLSLFGGNAFNPMAAVPKGALAANALKSTAETGRLIHGTLADNIPSIKDNWLEPQAGHFVENAYGGEYGADLPSLVYMADPASGAQRAANAVRSHVANKLNKSFHDVTMDDIRDHGAIVTTRPDPSDTWRMNDDQTSTNLSGDVRHLYDDAATAEPGDYFSFDAVAPTGFLTGDRLVDFWKNNKLYSDSGKPSLMGSAIAGAQEASAPTMYRGVRMAENPGPISPDSPYYWMTSDPDLASNYALGEQANVHYQTPAVIPAVTDFKNPMTVDAQGQHWMRVPQPDGGTRSTDGLAYDALTKGHDGLVVNNVNDAPYDGMPAQISTVSAALRPGTVKSPLTGETLFSDTGKPNIMGAALATAGEQSPQIQNALRVARELDSHGFYSPSLEASKSIPQEVGTVGQMKSMLLKNGAKPKELEALSFDEAFPDVNAKVNRQDIEDFLRGNRVGLGRERYGDGDAPFSVILSNGKVVHTTDSKANADATARSFAGSRVVEGSDFTSGDSKFESYSTPGGIPGSYRETIATLPFDQKVPLKIEKLEPFGPDGSGDAMWQGRTLVRGVTEAPFEIGNQTIGRITHWPETFDFRGRPEGERYVVNSPNMQNAQFKSLDEAKAAIQDSYNMSGERRAGSAMGQDRQDVYTSSHWPGITNPLLHYRTKDFPGVDGSKTRVLDEMQSDWAQRARDVGAKDPAVIEALQRQRNDVMAKYEAMSSEAASDMVKAGAPDPRSNPNAIESWLRSSGQDDRASAFSQLRNEGYDLNSKIAAANNGVPNAPFIGSTSDWTDLGLKHALLDAARDPLVDRLAWAPGKVQADRYGLEKHVSELSYNPQSQILTARLHNGRRGETFENTPPEKIADIVGKEAAEKLLAQPLQQDPMGYAGHILSGTDLKLGGEGMKGYYDKIIPQRLQKLLKGIDPDARVGEPTDIKLRSKFDDRSGNEAMPRSVVPGLNNTWGIEFEGGAWQGGFASEAAAQAEAARIKAGNFQQYPSVSLTPRLRQKLLDEGLSLFADQRPSILGSAIATAGDSPLPMDHASRMARAKELGFDTDTTWYHGSNRVDRLLEKPGLDPKRATSGPMPFFTDDPAIASNYATGKTDTSLPDDVLVQDYFNVSPKALGFNRSRTPIGVEQSWNYLTPEQRSDIMSKVKRVGYEDLDTFDGPLTLHPEGVDASLNGSHLDDLVRRNKGNPLAALREMWLEGGALYDDPSQLADIWKLAGYPHQISEASAPWYSSPGVMPARLRMSNPLDTSDAEAIKSTVIPALKEAFKRDRTQIKEFGADPWDKASRYTPKDWVAELEANLSSGDNSYVWTSIPDKVTAELKKLGYDGILDTGGKGGGAGHRVAVPFEPNQVRSTSAAFDPAKTDKSGLLLSDTGKPNILGSAIATAGETPTPQTLKPFNDSTPPTTGGGVRPFEGGMKKEDSSSSARSRAIAGGEVGRNGYTYRGGQFLPNTEAPPGTWKIKTNGKSQDLPNRNELIAPGVQELSPTPFARPVFGRIKDLVNIDNSGVATLKNLNWDYFGSPDEKTPVMFKNFAKSKESFSINDMVDLYNKGVRWVDAEPVDGVEIVAKGRSK